MTPPAPSPPAARGFVCSARLAPGGQELSADEADRACRFAARRGREWGAAICSHLEVPPPPPITITLRPAIRWSMTKGSEVVIGVSPGVVSAALAHELVHAVAGPSPSQALAEGLAVHVDAQLRLAGLAWPFFHLSPRRWARSFLDDGTSRPLADLLSDPRVAPSDEPGLSGAARFYLQAASLVGFALDELGGIDRFWPCFRSGDLLAGRHADALEGRWAASLGPPLSSDEQRRRDASLALLADDGRLGMASPLVGTRSARPEP